MAEWSVVRADAADFLAALEPGVASLIFGSPPYTAARSYLENGVDLGIARGAEDWSAWMVRITQLALRACNGLVAWVIEGQTRDYSWDAAPLLLGADLARAGVTLRRPCYYRRSGIPGSGGPDWFRCDAEIVLCCTNGGKLPWSDVTACGHPPKWAPGGEMSHRLSDGTRRNAWGMNGTTSRRRKDGKQENQVATAEGHRKPHTKAKRSADGDVMESQSYKPPQLANPGNVVNATYTAQQVDDMLGVPTDFVDCVVGGNMMGEGDAFSRDSEAPFPETLAERFIRSFAPPGGLVVDPFSGSGTTGAVAVRWGRRFAGCDLRQSQVDLSTRRIQNETPLSLYAGG